MTHWLLVSSPENFELSRSRHFDIAAMKSRWRKAAHEIAPGDTIFFYLTGVKAIGGEAVIKSEAYEDHTPIWTSSKPNEVYPFRFQIKMQNVRDKDKYLPVGDFIQLYQYAKRWPEERWSLAFQGNVHRLNKHDYELIHKLI